MILGWLMKPGICGKIGFERFPQKEGGAEE